MSIQLPSQIQNVDPAMMYEHEKREIFVRPDMSYAWTAAASILDRYPRKVRECNDLLRVGMGTFTPYRYAWVHSKDLKQRYTDPNTHSVHWLSRVAQDNRYYLCFLEPTTVEQQRLRTPRDAYKHGVDFQLTSINGGLVRTEPDKLPDTIESQRCVNVVRQTYRLTQSERVYEMFKGMNDCKAAKAAHSRIDELVPLRFPGSVDGNVSLLSDVAGAKLEAAGIGESPVLANVLANGKKS